MVEPKDDKLQIGDEPNNDKHKHVDVPSESEIQQDLRMVQRNKVYLKFILEIRAASGVKTKLDLTIQQNSTLASLLMISQRDLRLQRQH